MVALENEMPGVAAASIGATAPAAPGADAIPLALRRRGGVRARQVLAVALIGSLLLAMFASRDLSAWLDRLGDGPALAPLQHAAAGWDHAMTGIGFGRPAEFLRRAMRRLLDAEW